MLSSQFRNTSIPADTRLRGNSSLAWKIALVLVLMAFGFGDVVAVAWAAHVNGQVLFAAGVGFVLISAFLLVSILLMERR